MKKLFLMLFITALVLLSCAQPPTEEMNMAIQALDRAENDVGALVYAQNYLSRARDAFERMQNDANSKRFDSARQNAAEVIANSERAISEGNIAAARTANEALNFLDVLENTVTETEASLYIARQIEDIQLDFEPLEEILEIARADLESAEESYSIGDYTEAIDIGQTIRSSLSEVDTQINQAAQALSPKN